MDENWFGVAWLTPDLLLKIFLSYIVPSAGSVLLKIHFFLGGGFVFNCHVPPGRCRVAYKYSVKTALKRLHKTGVPLLKRFPWEN